MHDDLSHRGLALVLMGSVVTLLSVQPADAVVSAWTSAPSTADWSDSGNWDAAPPQDGDALTFGASTQTTLNNNLTSAAWVIPSITFNSGASAYTISGNDFTLGNGTTASTVIANSSANTQTIHNNIALSNAAQTISTTAGGGNVTLSGNLSGAGTNSGIVKTGAGSLTLSGSSNYQGATSVNEGKLIVSGSLTASPVSVATGAVLNVDGVVNGLITSAGTVQGQGSVGALQINAGGKLAPGQSTSNSDFGTLTANGDVTFADSTSTFTIRLGQTTGDQLVIAGDHTLTLNKVTLSLDLSAYTFTSGDVGKKFVIVSGGSALTGIGDNVFNQGAYYTAANGDLFDISYASSLSGGNIVAGSDIVLEFMAVPEPATWGMVLTGLGMFLGAQRTRRSRAAR